MINVNASMIDSVNIQVQNIVCYLAIKFCVATYFKVSETLMQRNKVYWHLGKKKKTKEEKS